MASTKEYLDYVLDQMSGLPEVTVRAMMGEYILYCRGRIFGGVYDDRLLLKDVPAARERMPGAVPELPYEGGSPMLPAEDMDDREALQALVLAMLPELPEPRKKKPRE